MGLSMELVDRRENKLLRRLELRLKVFHPGMPTPSRKDVKALVAANLGIPEDRVIVAYVKTPFGTDYSKAYVKVYESVEDAKKIEPDYVLRRNGLIGGE